MPIPPSAAKLNRIDAASIRNSSTMQRATLACWLRYKPMVLAAMERHPRPYVFSPKNLSPRNVSTKIRDAIRGGIAFQYEESTSPGFTERLSSWYGEVVIKDAGNNVVIGPYSKEMAKLEVTQEGEGSTNALSFPTLSFEEITAFVLLLSHGRVSGPIIIRTPPNIALLEKRENVEIVTPDDGSLVLI